MQPNATSAEVVELIEVPHISEIGAGTSVEYLPFVRKRKIRPVKGARTFDRFISTRIAGDSLHDDGIFDGDYAICRLNFEIEELTNGRLVVIRTPVGLLMKHFYLAPNARVRLASANPDYPDLFFDIEDVEIQAIVVRTEREW
ncbi:MAG: hypothetical protein DMF64_06065 [Acidobacteria bacterium]|nr:MAG: hypothetical protein DMF64_06065 [Acidobacteriota bacterium]